MGLIGYHNGIPIFERVEDVADSELERGVKFYILEENAPPALIEENMAFYQRGSPILWTIWEVIGIIAICVAVTLVAYFVVSGLHVLLVESHQGRKIDEDTYEDASGCIYQRNEKGKWELVGCPSVLTGAGGWIILVIGLIAVILIVYGLYKSGLFRAAAKKVEERRPAPKTQKEKMEEKTAKIKEQTKKIKARTAAKKAKLEASS